MSISPCLISAGFLGSMVLTMMAKEDSPTFSAFHDSLDERQLQVYGKIKKERLTHYLVGQLFGLLSALAFFYLGRTESQGINACLFTVIVMTVTTFYYILAPKSAYMVTHLKDAEQVALWQDVYREMQIRYYLGFGLALVGYAVLSYALEEYWGIDLEI